MTGKPVDSYRLKWGIFTKVYICVCVRARMQRDNVQADHVLQLLSVENMRALNGNLFFLPFFYQLVKFTKGTKLFRIGL